MIPGIETVYNSNLHFNLKQMWLQSVLKSRFKCITFGLLIGYDFVINLYFNAAQNIYKANAACQLGHFRQYTSVCEDVCWIHTVRL